MKGVESVKWVMGIVTGILALSVTLGGVVTGYKLINLDKELEDRGKELSELQKKASLLVGEEQAFAKANGNLIARRIVTAMDDLLENFSLSLPNPKIVGELKEFRVTLTDLGEARAFGSTQVGGTLTEEEKSADLLKGLVTAVLDLESLKLATTRAEKLAKIAAATVSWKRLGIPAGLQSDAYSAFAGRCDAYRSNVLGVLAYIRADLAESHQEELLTEADLHFNKAIEHSTAIGFSFTRPRSNLALVTSKRIELLPPNSDPAKSYELFKAAHEHLDKAIRDEYSDRNLCLLYNNKASTYQDEAEFDRRHKDLKKARESFRLANEVLASALTLSDIHPVVYSTLAEIKAQEISLDYDEGKQVDFPQRSREVVDLIKKAIRSGYVGYKGLSIAEFFKKAKALENLRVLAKETGGTFADEIEKVLGQR